MLGLDHCDYLATRIVARPGASLGKCQVDALKLAIFEWVNVELTHGGKTYRLNVNDLLLGFKEEKG